MKPLVILFVTLLLPNIGFSGDKYEDILRLKKQFADNEIQAVSEPYVGVGSKDGIDTGLFTISSTGVSTKPIVSAATSFLSTLAEELRGFQGKSQMPKVEAAFEAGKLLAEKAKAAGIETVVFDRGGYKYHGRVKAFAEGARKGGLEF